MRLHGRRICAFAVSLCLVLNFGVCVSAAPEGDNGQTESEVVAATDMVEIASPTDFDEAGNPVIPDGEVPLAAAPQPGSEPKGDRVQLSLSGDTVAIINTDAGYILSAANMNKLATVTVWFEVDGDYFSGKSVKGLGGFEVLDGVNWEEAGGSLWNGRVTITNLFGGVTSEEYTEILKLTLSVKETLGMTDVSLVRVELSGYDSESQATYFDPDIENGTVSTDILESFSPYDVNRDGELDQLDVTAAQFYYMATKDDENWEEAKIADLNGDGRVDVEDLILILNNIDWAEILGLEALLREFEEQDPALAALPENPESAAPETEGAAVNSEGVTPETEGAVQNPEGVTPETEGAVQNPEGVTPETEGAIQNPEGVTPETEGPIRNPEGVTPETEGAIQNPEDVPPGTEGAAQILEGGFHNPNVTA